MFNRNQAILEPARELIEKAFELRQVHHHDFALIVQEKHGLFLGFRGSHEEIPTRPPWESFPKSLEIRGVFVIQAEIAGAKGAIRLADLAIDYPKAEISFSTESYFEPNSRSLEEVLAMADDGRLCGPTAAQAR